MTRPAIGRALLAGAAGTAAMTLSTAVEMRLRHRPASPSPARVIGRLTRTRPGPRATTAISWLAHVPFGMALGLVRAPLAALPEPAATAAFLAVAWLPDLAMVPAFGVAEPPWRWGARELAISGLHHVAYAVAGSLAWAHAPR